MKDDLQLGKLKESCLLLKLYRKLRKMLFISGRLFWVMGWKYIELSLYVVVVFQRSLNSSQSLFMRQYWSPHVTGSNYWDTTF